jgi:hypothetical protein
VRPKREYSSASKANYLLFQEAYPAIDIPFTVWQNVIYSFNYGFRDHLLETGSRAKLPWGFGDLMISKKKKKKFKTAPDGTQYINLSIDWKATREAGKRIYHTNDHTEGFNFYYRWEPSTARFYQRQLWSFKPSRISSRLLAHYLRQPDYQHSYLEWK